MKKITFYFLSILLFVQCSSVKNAQQAINQGDFTTAMNKSLKSLAKNKDKKGNQDHIRLLEDAFDKYQDRTLGQVKMMEKENNPETLKKRYESLKTLQAFQDSVRALQPLFLQDENRNARFDFVSLQNQITETKEETTAFLYDKAAETIGEENLPKGEYRAAYEDLEYVSTLFPNYQNTKNLMEQAIIKGKKYVYMRLNNQTQTAIPKNLEMAMLDFETYNLNDRWTSFENGINVQNADYELILDFISTEVSPERINETQFVKEKLVKDGFDYVLDSRGNVKKDSLGNDIKVDRMKKVLANFYRFEQTKFARVTAELTLYDVVNETVIERRPMESEFVFEHSYANVDGDRRALDNDLVALLDLAEVPFPSNEQMLFDASEDIKNQLTRYIKQRRF